MPASKAKIKDTKVKVSRVLGLYEKQSTIVKACRTVGIPIRTFWSVIKRDPKLKQRLEDRNDHLRGSVGEWNWQAMMSSDDPDKTLRWLERRDEEFKPRSEIQGQFVDAVMSNLHGADPVKRAKELYESINKAGRADTASSDS